MKHIGFDESTVMGEYARIANEKGIVKAAEISGSGGIAAVRAFDWARDDWLKRVQQVKQSLVKGLGGTPSVQGKTMGLPTKQTPESQQAMTAFIMVDFYKNWSRASLTRSQQDLQLMARDLVTSVNRIQVTLGNQKDNNPRSKLYGTVTPYDTAIKQLAAIQGDALERSKTPLVGKMDEMRQQQPAVETQKASQNTPDLSKQAEGQKCYDVSGETGEQLIDSAHPGGGTRTELSSKTDENLVETIVEQQKRDIEVARSVPKGTYAALVKLHNQLSKMGHSECLGSLKSAILQVATTEDIVSGTLVGLADKLDKLGYERSANRVDSLVAVAIVPPVFPLVPAAVGLAAFRGLVYVLDKMSTAMNNVIERLQDLDPTEGTPAASALPTWITRLQGYRAALQFGASDPDPEKNKMKIEKEKTVVNEVLRGLQLLKQDWNTKIKNNLDDWGIFGDISRAESAITQAISHVEGLGGQVIAPGGAADKAIQEESKKAGEAGIGAKTEETAAGKQPAKKNVFTDIRLAIRWGRKFNAVLKKVDPRFLVNDITPKLTVKTGDKESRKSKTVTGALRKSLVRAIKYWKKSGKSWKGLEAKLREDFKDQLAEKYKAGGDGAGGAEEEVRTKMMDEVLKKLPTGAANEPRITSLINRSIRSGSRFFDVTNSGGYNKVMETVLKQLREKGYLR